MAEVSGIEIVIRVAHRQDAGAIASILRELDFEPVNTEQPEATEGRVLQLLENQGPDQNQLVLVAEDMDKQVIGYVAVHWITHLVRGIEGYISQLYVRAGQRGRGINRRLLDAVKTQAMTRGCTRLMLHVPLSADSLKRRQVPQPGWVERDDAAYFVLHLEPLSHP